MPLTAPPPAPVAAAHPWPPVFRLPDRLRLSVARGVPAPVFRLPDRLRLSVGREAAARAPLVCRLAVRTVASRRERIRSRLSGYSSADALGIPLSDGFGDV